MTYQDAKNSTQSKADATGIDHGIEFNPIFKDYSVKMLPGKRFRRGWELRCEVVYCSDLSRCVKGHGP